MTIGQRCQLVVFGHWTYAVCHMRIRYPDFICVGAQKCGTTWLNENLKIQSGVALPAVKELHYFNEIWLPHQRDWAQAHRRKQVLDHVEWYVNNVPRSDCDVRHLNTVVRISEAPICDKWYGTIFADLPEHAIVGEMTPEYALLPLMGIQHILRLNEKMKFIFVVRDPIDRAWSQLKMIVRNEGLEPSLDTYRRIMKYQDIKLRSDYFETIRTIQQVSEFIGISATTLNFDRASEIIHEGRSGGIPDNLVEPMWSQLGDCYNSFERVAPNLVGQWRKRPRGKSTSQAVAS
jgi:hypothetical protein